MSSYAGFDRLAYPGDSTMTELFINTNLEWVGFYLAPAPSQSNISWMTKRTFLADLGWGFAPIYVGQQQPEPNSPGSHIVTAAQGVLDAKNATDLARSAGFPEMSVLYLDIETGGPIQSGLIDYYKSWVQGVFDNGFYPGLYCSFLLAGQFSIADARTLTWVFNITKFPTGGGAHFSTPFPNPDPFNSGSVTASLWQLSQGCSIQVGSSSSTLSPVDLDSSTRRDPSIFLIV